jgi:hypothetical protein
MCILFSVLNTAYLMPEDGKYGRNVQQVLTGLIKFVLAGDNTYVDSE